VNVRAPGDALDVALREFGAGQKIFGRYTLRRILGRGGMGIVWLAHDEVLERGVALKFLPEIVIFDRGVLADLKRETKRSLELTHKNIVRIYDFVHDENSGCISMEYIDGDTLSNLRADRPQKVFHRDEVTDWLKQACEALDYAHNHVRVVHRDLKPSNLMLNKRGELKVADFGIARRLSDSVSILTMGSRGTSGTLVYMSPQQLDGDRASHLDDIYSLGATIYELFTSKPPFFSGNIDRQIHERTPPPMNRRRQELEIEAEPIDETWEKLVAACLQKDPANRPQAVTEIIEWFAPPPVRKKGWFAFPTSPKTTHPTPSTRTKTQPPPKRRAREKKFRLAVGRIIAAGKEEIRGATLGIVSAGKATIRGTSRAVLASVTIVFRAAAAVAAVTGNLLLAAGRAFLVLIKETVRGTFVVMIPAAAIASCIWYFAIRPPPQKELVQQPPAKAQLTQQPKAQPFSSPIESQIALVAPVPPAATRTPESKPAPPPEGGLRVETAPAGANVIVDSSIFKTSPVTLSNLPAGKHHLQIALPDYATDERDVEIKGGEIASQGVIKLRAITPPQPAPTASAVQETVGKQPQEESEPKAAAAKKTHRPKQPVAAPITRQAATTSPSPTKIISKPAASPQQKPRRPFEGAVPGG
jgi:serine/threonine protein kinase